MANSSQLNQGFPAGGEVSKNDLRAFLATLRDETNHGGFVRPLGNGAVDRTAQDKANDFPCVRDWGALGNGSADDTSALQTAFNECSALTPVGGGLWVPDGSYMISSTLDFPGRLNLIAESWGSVIRLADDSDCVMLQSTSPTAELQQIRGLAFDGRRDQQNIQDGSLHCIDLQHGTDGQIAAASLYGLGSAKLFMHSLFIAHVAGDAIRVTGAGGGNMANIRIDSVLGNGLRLDAPAIGVDSLNIRRCGRNGVRSTGERNRFHTATVALCGIDDPNSEGYAYLLGPRNSMQAAEAAFTNGTAVRLEGAAGGIIQVMINAAGKLQSVVPTADAPYHGHLTGIDGSARGCYLYATLSNSVGGAGVLNSAIRETNMHGCNIRAATGPNVLASTAGNGRNNGQFDNGVVYTLSGQSIVENL